jgi:heme exporter protein C
MQHKNGSRFKLLAGLTFIAMPLALYLIFIYVPTEKVMGIVQRIFYFHVALGLSTMLSFTIVFVASILYLWRGDNIFDIVAYSAAELGVLFCSLVLITGPIWARPIWGAWWTWDARLTTTLILWLIYIAYLMLRTAARDSTQRANFCAVFGIIGYIDVPIVYLSVHWWRTIHPVVIKASGIALAPEMIRTMLVSCLAMTLLYLILLTLRIRIGKLRYQLEKIKHNL